MCGFYCIDWANLGGGVGVVHVAFLVVGDHGVCPHGRHGRGGVSFCVRGLGPVEGLPKEGSIRWAGLVCGCGGCVVGSSGVLSWTAFVVSA